MCLVILVFARRAFVLPFFVSLGLFPAHIVQFAVAACDDSYYDDELKSASSIMCDDGGGGGVGVSAEPTAVVFSRRPPPSSSANNEPARVGQSSVSEKQPQQSPSSAHECQQTRFHRYHGYNLSLHEQDTVAHREMSFANAIVFGERSLSPGEVFLIEIESSENGWSGHIRLGLTQLDPDALQRGGHLLPQCAIPDMVSNKTMGESWICALTKHQAWYEANYLSKYFRLDGNHVFTSRGTFPISILRRPCADDKMDILPTDVGSRVGVLYLPCGHNMAIMHFIINGEFVVPLSRTIPYNDGPIRAVIDVYGATKRVRIVQVYNGKTALCSLHDWTQTLF